MSDKIVGLAREAGFEELFKDSHDWVCFTEEIERFAALVAAHVRETEFKPDWNKYQQGLADGAAAEREACAKVCESMRPSEQEFDQRFYTACTLNANAIRARGQA